MEDPKHYLEIRPQIERICDQNEAGDWIVQRFLGEFSPLYFVTPLAFLSCPHACSTPEVARVRERGTAYDIPTASLKFGRCIGWDEAR